MAGAPIQQQLVLPRRRPEHDAVRVLLILHVFGRPAEESEICRLLEAEYHIQKTDFYLRNPDYLAWALLDRLEDGKGDPGTLCAAAMRILNAQEPELRRIPMFRLFRGAYEPLGDVEVLLVSRGLLRRRSHKAKNPTQMRRYVRTTYALTEKGCALVASLLAEHEDARWYHQRCELIRDLLGTNIPDFKRQQYSVQEYATTPLNELIPSIAGKVRQRAGQICDA